MRLPDFTHFTPDEKKAVLALLLLTGGGSLVIEAGRHRPGWTPDLKLVAAAGLRPGPAGEDSTAGDSLMTMPGGAGATVAQAMPDAGAGGAAGAAAAATVAGTATEGAAVPAPDDIAHRPLLAAALAAAPEVVAAGLKRGDDPERAAAAAPGSVAGPPAAPPPAAAPSAPDSARADGRVDINHADAAALGTLPGIGPKMAERILADRKANGLYRRAEELLRVKGIGPAKLAKLRDRIVIRR